MKSSNSVARLLLITVLAGLLLLASGGQVFASVPQPPAIRNVLNEPYVFYTNQSRLTPHRQYELSSAPIHSRATLQSYLAHTKIVASPLRYLSPLARKRFLASLEFNQKGLVSFYYKDLVQLPGPRSYYILNLFGAAYIAGMLRTCFLPEVSASPADQRAETATDVLVAPCQSFNLDEDAYFESKDALDTNRYARHEYEEYQQLFSRYQNSNVLQRLRDPDLHILFNITPFIESLNLENAQLRQDMALDFAEMERRHIATQSDVQYMYVSYINARMFKDARRFAKQHPKASLSPLPKITQAGPLPADMPTELAISTDQREMVRRPVNIKRGVKIVVVVTPFCHFAQHGLSAIRADSQLKSVFGKYAVWLAPDYPPFAFDDYQKWNREHPVEQIAFAYLPGEWPMIDDWSLPTFYFFKNGKLVTELRGWYSKPDPRVPDGGSVPAIKTALAKIGLIQPPT